MTFPTPCSVGVVRIEKGQDLPREWASLYTSENEGEGPWDDVDTWLGPHVPARAWVEPEGGLSSSGRTLLGPSSLLRELSLL